MSTINIASYNLRGIQTELKRRKAFNHFHEKKHDIILLQETHSTRSVERVWRNEWGNQIVFSHYNSRARGVAIMFRKSLNYTIIQKIICNDGRYIIIEIEIDGLTCVIVNVYAPNEDNDIFFVNLFQIIKKFANPYKIYGGDFNVVLDPLLDHVGSDDYDKPKSRQVILNHMASEDIHDLWRNRHPDSTRYTWMTNKPRFAGSRLDYWLISNPFVQFIEDIDIPPAILSDHASIEVKLKTSANPRGRGVWMLNNSLLEDKDYVKLIDTTIDHTISDHPSEDLRLVWEVLKMNIRGETIKFATNKKKVSENKKDTLEKKLKDVELQINNGSNIFVNPSEKWAQLTQIKDELDQLQEIKPEPLWSDLEHLFLNMVKKCPLIFLT